jgi:hypothetical protein
MKIFELHIGQVEMSHAISKSILLSISVPTVLWQIMTVRRELRIREGGLTYGHAQVWASERNFIFGKGNGQVWLTGGRTFDDGCARNCWRDTDRLHTKEQIRWLSDDLAKFRPEEVKVDEFCQEARKAIRKEAEARAWEIWEDFDHVLHWVEGKGFVEEG